jgi:hypothetical protein
MFENRFLNRYPSITYDKVVSLHKLFFSTSNLPTLITAKMDFRAFNQFMYNLLEKARLIFGKDDTTDTFTFDLFTLYNNMLSYYESVLSAKLVVDGDITNYTVGNEIVQVEVDLRYIYG